MNTTQAQQKALDDALVAPADRLEFGKYNMRLKTDIKPKEATFQVVLDALALTSFYRAFLITADFCLKIPRQVFEDLSLEQDLLSFIRYLGHTGDITYLTDVNVDYLHQPWRAFATVINKCLSGKETRMDKIHLLFQIENKDAKNTNKMSYPIFTKIIIDYFMSKDQSISKRNKMFWHTARDDTMFTSMRCISGHENTQVYGTILPTELTNQAMLESKAYQTYDAFASGAKAPKPKYIQKKADLDTSPKKKSVQTTKGTRLKSKAKVAKPDKKKQPAKRIKAKGSTVLSKVTLTEAEKIKLATKRSKKDFHVSHASGSDEGTDTMPGVPDVPTYESESDKESWGDSEDEDDNDDDGKSEDHDDDNDDERTKSDRDEIPGPNMSNVDQTEHEEEDDRVHTSSDYELTDDEKLDDEEIMDDKEDDEEHNISKESGFNQVEEDAHVIITLVIEARKADEPVQSSSVSSDFTSKLLNLDNPSLTDNEIASLMETSARHTTEIPKIKSGFTITTPLPPPVSALESQMSKFKQTNQFAKAVSSIPGIVDTYLASKMKEAVDMAVQLQTNKLIKEAQAENQEFFGQVDSTMKEIIKDQVKAQVSKIMPKIEKYVTESLGVEVLVGSTNQPQTSYAVATTLSEFKLKKILIEKMEANKSIDRLDIQKNLYIALVESYNNDNDIMSLYGDAVILKRGRHDQDKDEDPSAGSDRGTKRRKSGKDVESSIDSSLPMQRSQVILLKIQTCNKIKSSSREIMMNNLLTRRLPKVEYDQHAYLGTSYWGPKRQIFYGYASNLTSSKDVYSRRRIIALYTFKEGDFKRLRLQDIEDMLLLLVQQKLTNLIIDERYDLNVALRMFTRCIVIQRRVEDLQLGVESYQKKLNLTKPDTYRSNIRNKTAYTSHSDPYGIIYVDQFKRKRLMRTDELYKFSDGTLNDVQTALHDIAGGIRMEYLPMRK
ncbi:hypothetical protein Tco_1173938 [Tanacetum coccineum]